MSNSNEFSRKVLEIVKQIPKGKVTTYGHIAEKAGARKSSRMVGYILNSYKGDERYPFHRVVNRLGELSGKQHFPTPNAMKEMLQSEGINFKDEAVDMKSHLWIPDFLNE